MLTTPPLLLAAALLFWGWQSGLSGFAVLMALVIEASRRVRWRVDFTLQDYNRLFDLCTVVFGMAAVYCFTTRGTTNELMAFFESVNFTGKRRAMEETIGTTYVFFQWWPILMFPIIAAQGYGSRETLPWSTFSLLARRRLRREGRAQTPMSGVNVAYLYFALCLLSASLTNTHKAGFYFGFCGLMAAALWAVRPVRVSRPVWVISFVLVAGGGYWGQMKLRQLQSVVEAKFAGWLNELLRGATRREIGTEIGLLGGMKTSGSIVMRVRAEGEAPELLKDAAYNVFTRGRWLASHSVTTPVPPTSDGQTWTLLLQRGPHRHVEVAMSLPGGRGLLAAPVGTVKLLRLPVEELGTNRLSIKKTEGAPGLLVYDAVYGAHDPFDLPPLDSEDEPHDTIIPDEEGDIIATLGEKLRFESLAKPDRLRAVQDFFVTNQFKYSTFLPAALMSQARRTTTIGFFLTKSRAGHCEFFATATVLLLRQAGIPARYVVGWAVMEEGDAPGRFIVRERHAHAWTEYWMDGHWHTLDTTPTDWSQVEEDRASFWEPFQDRWSNFWYAFNRWRYYGSNEELRKYLLGALLILVAILAARMILRYRRRRRASESRIGDPSDAAVLPGADSEFYAVERRLLRMGYERYAGETLSDWAMRLKTAPDVPAELVGQLIRLHYRYRFDPRGLDPQDRDSLRQKAEDILQTPA